MKLKKVWNPILQFGKVLLFIFYGLLEIHKQIWKGQDVDEQSSVKFTTNGFAFENQQYVSNDPNL